MEGNRVVVTGMAPITPVGTGIESYWKALLNGVSGVGPITQRIGEGFAGEIDDVRIWDLARSGNLTAAVRFCARTE